MKGKSIAFLLSLISLFNLIDVVSATDNTPITLAVTSGTSYYQLCFAFQRSSFHAQGLYWQFWCDSTDFYYNTSSDGVTWSSAILARNGYGGSGHANGYDFCTFYDSSTGYMYYAYSSQYDWSPLYFRRGLPKNDGTITWDTEYTVNGTIHGPSYPQITIDSNGCPWVSFEGWTGTTGNWWSHPYVTKSTTTDGTWATQSGFPYLLNNTVEGMDEWRVATVPLTSGKVYSIFIDHWGTPGIHGGKLWNGTAWEAGEIIHPYIPGTPNWNLWFFEDFSTIAVGDDVYIAYPNGSDNLAGSSNVIYFQERQWGSEWSDPYVVHNFNGHYHPSYSISGDPNGTIIVWWTNSSNYIFYRELLDGTWGDEKLLLYESSYNTQWDQMTTYAEFYDDLQALCWSTMYSGNSQVRFASNLMLDLMPPGGEPEEPGGGSGPAYPPAPPVITPPWTFITTFDEEITQRIINIYNEIAEKTGRSPLVYIPEPNPLCIDGILVKQDATIYYDKYALSLSYSIKGNGVAHESVYGRMLIDGRHVVYAAFDGGNLSKPIPFIYNFTSGGGTNVTMVYIHLENCTANFQKDVMVYAEVTEIVDPYQYPYQVGQFLIPLGILITLILALCIYVFALGRGYGSGSALAFVIAQVALTLLLFNMIPDYSFGIVDIPLAVIGLGGILVTILAGAPEKEAHEEETRETQ